MIPVGNRRRDTVLPSFRSLPCLSRAQPRGVCRRGADSSGEPAPACLWAGEGLSRDRFRDLNQMKGFPGQDKRDRSAVTPIQHGTRTRPCGCINAGATAVGMGAGEEKDVIGLRARPMKEAENAPSRRLSIMFWRTVSRPVSVHQASAECSIRVNG